MWHHKERNKLVAAVAEAAVSSDTASLRRLGLRNEHLAALRHSKDPAVNVLVESPEHGRELLSLLPEWPLLADGSAAINPASHGDTPDTVGPAIVTTAYAAQHVLDPDVVIRATGTPWPLRLRDFPPSHDDQHTKILIVDFTDGQDPGAAAAAQRRIQGYRRRQMTVISASSAE